MSKSPSYRGRLAPSPTGLLHLGHVRTFQVAADRAREAFGILVLRNEDLDPARSRLDFAQAMVKDLRWLGIVWDEGPDCGGPYTPYTQSERYSLYLAAWGRLVESGSVYPCCCSRRESCGRVRVLRMNPRARGVACRGAWMDLKKTSRSIREPAGPRLGQASPE